MRCVIWYYLYNLKNVKNTHEGVLILVKLQASACNFTKINTLPRCFSQFSNCTNATKSRNVPHISQDLVWSEQIKQNRYSRKRNKQLNMIE